MLLKTTIEIIEVKKRSQGKLFKDVKVGHQLLITKELQYTSTARGNHASVFHCYNLTTKQGREVTETMLLNFISNFAYEEKDCE